MQQNQQSANANLANSVLHRAKPEILRVVEMLITKLNAEVIDLLVEVCTMYCIQKCFHEKLEEHAYKQSYWIRNLYLQ